MLDETIAANPGMKSLTLNIEDPAAISAFAAKVAADFPTLNVLINNAGIMRPENLASDPPDLANASPTPRPSSPPTCSAPSASPPRCCPHLQKQPHATIVTVSSGLAFIPIAVTPTYCATKAAIHSWTQSLRYQLRNTNIEVLELAPPYVQTELMGRSRPPTPAPCRSPTSSPRRVTLFDNPPASGEILVKTRRAPPLGREDRRLRSDLHPLNGAFTQTPRPAGVHSFSRSSIVTLPVPTSYIADSTASRPSLVRSAITAEAPRRISACTCAFFTIAAGTSAVPSVAG